VASAVERQAPYRIGLIVPSSNTTMETELPELFRRRERQAPERFTFHSARLRMTEVTPEALAAMNAGGERAAAELADAGCDAMAYACLVAVMIAGPGAHVGTEAQLSEVASTPVVTSAGALPDAIRAVGATRVAMIAPYLPPLTERVVAYLGDLGIEVVDAISLGIADNREVGRQDPARLVELAGRLDRRHAEAIVLSACVQMPSLPAITEVERRTGLPVVTAATATAHALLGRLGPLGLPPMIDGAGWLLAGRHLATAAL
jgi:maleate isomerase